MKRLLRAAAAPLSGLAAPARAGRVCPRHPRLHERDFVLAPLADLLRGSEADAFDENDVLRETAAASPPRSSDSRRDPIQTGLRAARATWLSRGGERVVGTDAIRRVAPFGKNDTLRTWGENTEIMGILNATPDSFSDGGELDGEDEICISKAVKRAKEMVAAGASFVDVGGQSTRPGATRVSAAEEARRVVPVIRALAEALRDTEACVSVDTFYGAVAAAAADAGADVVNDVSGGTLCEEMYRAVASTARPLPYVCMHMRGDPRTMQSRAMTTYVVVSRSERRMTDETTRSVDATA